MRQVISRGTNAARDSKNGDNTNVDNHPYSTEIGTKTRSETNDLSGSGIETTGKGLNRTRIGSSRLHQSPGWHDVNLQVNNGSWNKTSTGADARSPQREVQPPKEEQWIRSGDGD